MATKKPSKKAAAKKAPKPVKKPVAKKTVAKNPNAKVAKVPKAQAPKVAKVKAPKPTSGTTTGMTLMSKGRAKEDLKVKILDALKTAGETGLHIKSIAEKTGRTVNGIAVWFSTTANDKSEIVKIAPATYALKNAKAAKVTKTAPKVKAVKKTAKKKKS